MHADIEAFNRNQHKGDHEICNLLASVIDRHLPEAESKIWHRHPVWFLNGNPTVGYSRQKAGIRLMFWSGADFGEPDLKPGTGKFKDASMFYTSVDQVVAEDLKRWLAQRCGWSWSLPDRRSQHSLRTAPPGWWRWRGPVFRSSPRRSCSWDGTSSPPGSSPHWTDPFPPWRSPGCAPSAIESLMSSIPCAGSNRTQRALGHPG